MSTRSILTHFQIFLYLLAGTKRKSISFEGDNNISIKKPSGGNQSNRGGGNFKKRPLGMSKVYAPPQGKYSSNLDRVGK